MKLELYLIGSVAKLTNGIRNFPPFTDNPQVKNIQFWDGTGQF